MKPSKHGKLERHPDKEEIIARLCSGESLAGVYNWLRGKYGNHRNSARLCLSQPTLQIYRQEVLKLEGQVLLDLQAQKRADDNHFEQQVEARAVHLTSAYKETINKVASAQLDVSTRILQLDAIVGERIESWFNMIKSGEEVPRNADTDLRKYIDQEIVLLQQWRKLVEGMADRKVDYNVNITVMNDQIQTIQSVIRDLVCEKMGPEQALEFIEELNNRLTSPTQPKALPGKVEDVGFKVLNG